MIKNFLMAFGVIFTLIGLGVIIGGFVHKNSINNSREVSGKIVDFIERKVRNSKGRTRTYKFPVYEYYDDGEYKRYESNLYTAPPKPLGTDVTLYISEDGKVREEQGTLFMFLFGGIFALAGIILAVYALVVFNGRAV